MATGPPADGLEGEVVHHGGCHCGAVQFRFTASPRLVAWDCNCSICHMKRNVHVIVPAAKFELLHGKECLTLYTFNTHTAKHYFCKVCGVQSYYRPRSNPDGYGVTLHCIHPSSVQAVEVRRFDGRNWEQYIDKSGIGALSKL